MSLNDSDQELTEIYHYGVVYADNMLAQQETKVIDHFGFWIILTLTIAIILGGTFEWLRRRA